jgi:phosphotransacetylase
MSFDHLTRIASARGSCPVGFVGAAAHEVLGAARRALDNGIASPILIGDGDAIERAALSAGISTAGMSVEDAPDDQAAAVVASRLVRDRAVGALLKGRIPTWILMQEGLRSGLREGDALISHVALIELSGLGRPLLVTDSALTPFPTLEQRVELIRNAVTVMRRLGVATPRTALLSASEEVNERIPTSIEARRIAEMNAPGGPLESLGLIGGPLDLGCAVHPETARIKGVTGPVAGDADILVAPDIVVANTLSKALIYLAGGSVAACVVGAAVPIGMVSRASPARDKYNALLLALACR